MATDVTEYTDVQDEVPAKSSTADGPLSEEDVQRIASAAIIDAIQYTDEVLSPARAQATDFYFGRPFGDEEEGRSKVVSTDVRDSILSVLPSVLRVVFGPERVVEYVPKRADAAADAEQQTDYIFHVFEEQQGGFLKTHAVLKDGLLKKLGIFKWWWEEERATVTQMTGLTMDQVVALEADPDVEVTRVTPRPGPKRRVTTRIKQALGLVPGDEPTFDVTVKRIDREGHICIEAVPPEEFCFSRQARGLDRALCILHRTEKTQGELIAMGIDPELIDEWGGRDLTLETSPEEIARRDGLVIEDPEAGAANDPILYCEAWMPLDLDGDGIAELCRVCTLGPSYHVIEATPTDDIPFAVFCPDPEPHVIAGQSWADRTMDIQNIKSHVLRAMLDSAAASIFPRTTVVEGKVNIADAMNPEIGALIRQQAPGMVGTLATEFVGREMLAVLSYLDDMTERRTGRNKAAAGLDADALQSTTREGVNAALQGSQDQVELLTRIFCEQTLKPLFRGLRKLTVQHQPRKKVMRLRGKWVEIDPRTWDANADVTVNVALGSTLGPGRQAALAAILQKQETILAQLGLGQPIVSPAQYANTLRRFVQSLGFRDADVFFSPVPEGWQPPPQQPQETPEQTLAKAQLEIEQLKAQKDIAIKEAELRLKEQQQQIDAELELRKLAVDETLRRYQIDAQFRASFTQAQLEADAAAQERFLKAQQQGHDQALAAHEAALAAEQQAHEQQMAEQQAAGQQAAPPASE